MIPKIICFIFGHKLFEDIFTGKYGRNYNPFSGGTIEVPIMKKVEYDFCLRCGELNPKLKKYQKV